MARNKAKSVLLLGVFLSMLLAACGNFATTPTPVTNQPSSNNNPASSNSKNANPTTTPVTSNNVVQFAAQVVNTLPNSNADAVTPLAWDGKGKLQDGTFYSPILARRVPYRIYLPPTYSTTNNSFPVLYMLHGLSGSYTEWTDYGLLNYSDDLIAAGQIPPFIIVLPSGEQSYWFNWANDGPRWGDYLAYDVVGHIDATYRTIRSPASRAVGGHSMGGHGSLQLAFNYPSVFGVVGAHSPTLRTKLQADEFTREKPVQFWGDQSYYATIDPVTLARNLPQNVLSNLKIWLDVGSDDLEWRPRTEELHNVLDSRGIAHQWQTPSGEHGGEYWIAHVKDYIRFYATALQS